MDSPRFCGFLQVGSSSGISPIFGDLIGILRVVIL